MKHATRLVVPLLASLALAWGSCANAASHREAPLIGLDPAATTPMSTPSSVTTRPISRALLPIGASRSF